MKIGYKCKKQRKAVKLVEKLSVIKRYENNEHTVDIVQSYRTVRINVTEHRKSSR
jgi:pterin-4a-carbinolamine dehydratase